MRATTILATSMTSTLPTGLWSAGGADVVVAGAVQVVPVIVVVIDFGGGSL